REAPVLRGDERDGVALILDELRRRQMTCAAELDRLDDRSRVAYDRLSHDHLLDLCTTFTAHDLRTKREQFVLLRDERRAVNGRQPADDVNCLAKSIL